MDRYALRIEIDELYADYVACLDDDELERWPEFFTDSCLYKIVPRENYERDLPLALMMCESQGMLRDRVAAVRKTSVFAPRALRHLVGSIRINEEPDGGLRVRANFVLMQSTIDQGVAVFNAGQYLDRLVRLDGRLKFQEKLCILDGSLIAGSLIYPI
ncbi:MAG: aromatic-ring-hydroxylating dioxygenase subunit beta [Deltaproteobacteria bacterium]|nr:aromatic-ring-hydroxylating dioxygenase subunit beta [Deltaproteobacteria bacterium]MBI3386533.1 aromatic-ring-hydroxylating dioxygenase subunit beta [Deltaproteobacteria bacterium]